MNGQSALSSLKLILFLENERGRQDPCHRPLRRKENTCTEPDAEPLERAQQSRAPTPAPPARGVQALGSVLPCNPCEG